jgi:hypothetical protein
MSGRRLPISLDRTATFANRPPSKEQPTMINPDIRFARGRERQKTLLVEAETARRLDRAAFQQTGHPVPPMAAPAATG